MHSRDPPATPTPARPRRGGQGRDEMDLQDVVNKARERGYSWHPVAYGRTQHAVFIGDVLMPGKGTAAVCGWKPSGRGRWYTANGGPVKHPCDRCYVLVQRG